MVLISVILSLLTERYLGSLEEFRRYHWFTDLTDRLRELVPELARRPLLSSTLLVALPALLVLLAALLFDAIWAGFGFAFALAVLLYSYGPQDLNPQIAAVIDARLRGDDEAARWHLCVMLGGKVPDDPRQLTRTVMETVLVEINDRLLGVIFWFALLGPAGALGFRLASLLKTRFHEDTSGLGAAAEKLYFLLAWVPARLTGFSYALMGNFTESMRYQREEANKWPDTNRGVLVTSGLGALQQTTVNADVPSSRLSEIADLRATSELLRRTVLAWLVALGVLMVVGTSMSWLFA